MNQKTTQDLGCIQTNEKHWMCITCVLNFKRFQAEELCVGKSIVQKIQSVLWIYMNETCFLTSCLYETSFQL